MTKQEYDQWMKRVEDIDNQLEGHFPRPMFEKAVVKFIPTFLEDNSEERISQLYRHWVEDCVTIDCEIQTNPHEYVKSYSEANFK